MEYTGSLDWEMRRYIRKLHTQNGFCRTAEKRTTFYQAPGDPSSHEGRQISHWQKNCAVPGAGTWENVVRFSAVRQNPFCL